jgi:hypothetical protein
VKSWSACVGGKGYEFNEPLNALGKFERDFLTTKPSAAEIQAAVADVKCKQETNLIATWHRINAEYETKAIEKNQLALTEERRRVDAALKKAVEIIEAQ